VTAICEQHAAGNILEKQKKRRRTETKKRKMLDGLFAKKRKKKEISDGLETTQACALFRSVDCFLSSICAPGGRVVSTPSRILWFIFATPD